MDARQTADGLLYGVHRHSSGRNSLSLSGILVFLCIRSRTKTGKAVCTKYRRCGTTDGSTNQNERRPPWSCHRQPTMRPTEHTRPSKRFRRLWRVCPSHSENAQARRSQNTHLLPRYRRAHRWRIERRASRASQASIKARHRQAIMQTKRRNICNVMTKYKTQYDTNEVKPKKNKKPTHNTWSFSSHHRLFLSVYPAPAISPAMVPTAKHGAREQTRHNPITRLFPPVKKYAHKQNAQCIVATRNIQHASQYVYRVPSNHCT